MRWIFVLTLVGALAAPDVRPLLVGSRAPGSGWQDEGGNDFDLQAALDARPTVFVFYRAHWRLRLTSSVCRRQKSPTRIFSPLLTPRVKGVKG
jgi:hypothetical protein